jgi:molybdopterin molybdotransferase
MLSPAEAEKQIFEAMPEWPREDCALEQAHGRILRAEIRADRDLPPFDRAMLDGYAFRASALAAGIRIFRVEAVQAAGAAEVSLGPRPDACVEIMTGAVMPQGADCVVGYEDMTREGGVMTIAKSPGDIAAGHAVHRRGSDHRAGEGIVAAGTRLTGREIAVAAACGFAVVSVSCRPRIAIVATGDELVDVDVSPAPHQIRRSNDWALRAALAGGGYPGAEVHFWRDDPAEVERGLKHVLSTYGVVLFTGSVSRGKFDHLPAQLEKQGARKIFHGVAQRPGKPFWFGIGPGGAPLFALPGNPVSSYTCLHRYVLPALDRASGLASKRRLIAALSTQVRSKRQLAFLMPVRVASGPRAELMAEPAPGNTSGDFSGLANTDGFVELPASEIDFPAGHLAPFHPWMP